VSPELTSVADDEAVVFEGPNPHHYPGLVAGSEQQVGELVVRTLPRPGGERLSTVTTVNDLHFGEVTCGVLDGVDLGPALRAEAGQPPYPEVMNRGAVTEMAAARPDAVVVKGDLTSAGSAAEYAAFESVYRPVFGDRLVVTRGNHDNPPPGPAGGVPAPPPVQEVALAGVRLAVLDTSRPGWVGGHVSSEQAEWLDELAARSDRPVLVFGHHPGGGADIDGLFPSAPGTNSLGPKSTARLATVINRRPAILGYFAGHTHRNKVRRLADTGAFPWVEVACVKDFPGTWAEYRVFDGGILQVHRRVHSTPEAVRWSERCRSLFGGWYPAYAFGEIEDRCFEIPLRE
jgi:3',5'-cyclic AMP phosphodiesterase CpdA